MLDIFAEEDDIFSENYTEVSVLSATVCVCVHMCVHTYKLKKENCIIYINNAIAGVGCL